MLGMKEGASDFTDISKTVGNAMNDFVPINMTTI